MKCRIQKNENEKVKTLKEKSIVEKKSQVQSRKVSKWRLFKECRDQKPEPNPLLQHDA